MRKMKGRTLQVEGVQKMSVATEGKEPKKENKKSGVVGLCTETVEEKASKHDFKDTEELCNGGAPNRKDPTLCGSTVRQFDEELPEKYKVEVTKRDSYKGRGEPLVWRTVQRVNKCQLRKWDEELGENLHGSWNTTYNETQMHAGKSN